MDISEIFINFGTGKLSFDIILPDQDRGSAPPTFLVEMSIKKNYSMFIKNTRLSFSIDIAKKADINAVVDIYDRIHTLEEEGKVVIGWNRKIYPIRKTAEEAFDESSLFVMRIKDKVVASAIINHHQPEGYNSVDWGVPADEDKVGVLHTLVVHPDYSNLGLGKEFVAFFEEYCKLSGCRVVRLDTQVKNNKPYALYPKRGYNLAAIKEVPFQNLPEKVELAIFEKKL